MFLTLHAYVPENVVQAIKFTNFLFDGMIIIALSLSVSKEYLHIFEEAIILHTP